MLAQSQRRMLTPAATAWIDEHLPADAIFWTDGVVIEHRRWHSRRRTGGAVMARALEPIVQIAAFAD